MINFLKTNLLILIIILILCSYLGIKAFDENGWDGWGFGSAETLMSINYWAKDGFAKNYFLYLPRPYSKLIHYFDAPNPNRNNQTEILKNNLNDNGKFYSSYYTHYPSGYLIPYALMAKMGVSQRAIFRIFSILISLLGLTFLYRFIKSVSDKSVAIISLIYYGFSATFLNYADSISVQPLTYLFTYLILFLSILTLSNPDKSKKYNAAIWFSYLVLSVSSYDTTVFIFAWLVGLDIIISRKFLWKKWFIFASAPILGFALQILQNAYYLGWPEMIKDFSRTYFTRQTEYGSLRNFVLGLSTPFAAITGLHLPHAFQRIGITLFSAASILAIFWHLKERAMLSSKYFKILFILVLASVIQPLFINITGLWEYQGSLTAPFWGLLIGAASVFTVSAFKQAHNYKSKEKILFGILIAFITGLWSVQFYNTWYYVKDWPNNKPDSRVIEYAKIIRAVESGKERIVFRTFSKNTIYASIFPTFNLEYYINIPTMDFFNNEELISNFWRLQNISQYPFYSIITGEKNDVEKIHKKISVDLKNKGVGVIKPVRDHYLFVVEPIQK